MSIVNVIGGNENHIQHAGNGVYSLKNGMTEGKSNGQTDVQTEGDSINISAQGLTMLQEQEQTAVSNDKDTKAEEQALKDMYEEQADASDEAANQFKDMTKMMEIARRIANGDKVPGKDEQKLMEYNSKLYQSAKQAAIMNQNKKHKTYKSMFEDEEDADKREQLDELAKENEQQSVEETQVADTVSGEVSVSTE